MRREESQQLQKSAPSTPFVSIRQCCQAFFSLKVSLFLMPFADHKYKRYRQLKAAALSHKPKQPPQSDPQFPTRSLTSTPSAVRNGRRRSAEGSDGTPRSSSIRYDIFSLSESVSEPQRRTEQPLIRPINPPELRLSFAVAQHYNTKQDDYHEWMEEGVDEVRGIRRRSAIEEVTKELLQGPLQSGCDDCAPIAQQDGEDSSDDESDATPPSSPITFVDVEDDRWHEAVRTYIRWYSFHRNGLLLLGRVRFHPISASLASANGHFRWERTTHRLMRSRSAADATCPLRDPYKSVACIDPRPSAHEE